VTKAKMLESLPPELLEKIIIYLDVEDVSALAEASKIISSFKTAFWKRYCMLKFGYLPPKSSRVQNGGSLIKNMATLHRNLREGKADVWGGNLIEGKFLQPNNDG
jgi:hypothetical protein